MKNTVLAVLMLVGAFAMAEEPAAAKAAKSSEAGSPSAEVAEPVDATAAGPAEARPPSLEIALKVGGHFPQVLSKLDTTFDGSLTVGFAPFQGHQLQFNVAVGYSAPAHRVSSTDPRLGTAGGDYSSRLVEQDLATTIGVKYFILPPTRFLVPYAGAGFRVHFLRADVTGSGGADFGNHNETDTRFGGVLLGGVGLHLGPGLLLAELSFDYSPIGQRVTGDANVGSLAVVLGYGLLLF